MLFIVLWVIFYGLVVTASILLLGRPSVVLGDLNFKSLLKLLVDWQFLLGGFFALCARFIFIIINNLASKTPGLSDAHLSITTLATTSGIIMVVLANHFLLHERLTQTQLLGGAVIILGVYLIFK